MNPIFWKPPPSRLGLVLSWGAVSALFFLVLLLLNLGHETSHWFLWKQSNIPSCVYFNVTNPVGGLQLDPRFLWGLVGGPLFNLTTGIFLIIPYRRFPSIRGFLIWVITYSLLIRPVVMLSHLLSPRPDALPPDEVFLHRILSAAHGELVASLVVAGALTLMLTGIFLLWLGPVKMKTQCRGVSPYISTVVLVAALILPVVIMGLLVTIVLSPISDTPLLGVCS